MEKKRKMLEIWQQIIGLELDICETKINILGFGTLYNDFMRIISGDGIMEAPLQVVHDMPLIVFSLWKNGSLRRRAWVNSIAWQQFSLWSWIWEIMFLVRVVDVRWGVEIFFQIRYIRISFFTPVVSSSRRYGGRLRQPVLKFWIK